MQITNKNSIKNIINKAKFKSEKGDFVLFTNGNGWYIDTLIQNLLKSINLFDNKYKIIVFCTDKDAMERCKRLGYEFFEYVDIPELDISNITENYDNKIDLYTRLTFVKTVIISYILELGIIPFYLDPDMSFKKESIDDLFSYLKEPYELVTSGTDKYMNSNILIAKPTIYTHKLFDVKLNDVEYVIQTERLYSDEDFLRPRLIFDKTVFICQKRYPPGCNAKQYIKEAGLIHANCVIGLDNKIQLLKECDAWYL